MKVEVYFNLHKKVFSVRSTRLGRVILHTEQVHIKNPTFVVRQSGRKRVIAEGVKNVHAFVRGEIVLFDEIGSTVGPMSDLAYNPYKYDSFVCKDSMRPIRSATKAYLSLNTAGKPVITAEGV
jgi:hypothetical protein